MQRFTFRCVFIAVVFSFLLVCYVSYFVCVCVCVMIWAMLPEIKAIMMTTMKSICNVRAPYSGVGVFGNISSPFCTLAILWTTRKIWWRSSQGNPSVGGVKRKRGSKMERWWTYKRLYLIPMSRSGLSSADKFLIFSYSWFIVDDANQSINQSVFI